MKVKYCLPIIKSKTDEVLKIISENQNSYDFFEVWLDYIENLDEKFMKQLPTKFHDLDKMIFLFRRQNLETPVMDFKKRKKIIDTILESTNPINSRSRSYCPFIDLDISQKEELEYLEKSRPGVKLILSYHNYKNTPNNKGLIEIIESMGKHNPMIYKLSTFCNTENDALRLISILLELKEKNKKFVVLGMGKYGEMTRIQGTELGNEMVFAPLSVDEKSAEGQLTLDEYRKIFEAVAKSINICSYIGDPSKYSLSPLMHNAGYEELGIQNQFIYVSRLVRADELEQFINNFRNNPQYVGLSVGIPHKQQVMQYLDKIDEVAKKIGAVNTVVKQDGKLKGYNTDYLGIITPLKEKVQNLNERKVAIIGAGGTARASAYALIIEGAIVTIFNRDVEKAKKLSKDFNCEYDSLDHIDKVSNFDIIINATSVGMNSKDLPIIPSNLVRASQIIFDVIYPSTLLIEQAKKQGAVTISGLEMLLYQGVAQFELFTGKKAPIEQMRKTLI